MKEQKPYKCPYEKCNAAFNRKWRLKSHICTHTGEKLYFCSEFGCSKGYTTIGHLRRHVANSHSPWPKMICEYTCAEEGCKKVYRSMNSVKKHYIRHHEKEQYEPDSHFGSQHQSHKCTPCDQQVPICGHLTNNKYTSFKCSSYKCDQCNEHFSSIRAWKKHAKIHLTFKCDIPECSEEFPQFALLKKHKKFHHRKSIPSCSNKFLPKHNLEAHILPNDRKSFLCPYKDCNRVYTRKSNLDQHIRSGHRDIKFQCTFPGCEKKLVTKQKLQEHMKRHDPNRVPPARKQIARRQRKDAGKPKRSMAIKLSGLKVTYEEEKNILCSEVNQNSDYIFSDERQSESSDTSDDGNQSSDTQTWSDVSEGEDLGETSDINEGINCKFFVDS